MQGTNILFLVVGIAVGAGLALLGILSSQRQKMAEAAERGRAETRNEMASQLNVLGERVANRDREIGQKNDAISSLQELLESARIQVETLTAENARNSEKLRNQASALEETKNAMKAEFSLAATEALKGNRTAFLAEAKGELEEKRTAIAGLLTPMSDTLTALGDNVRSLKQSEESLLNETKLLATALNDSKQVGNWGELQLRRIVELAGMQDHCDFILQDKITTEENKLLYPDMTAHLPNNRVVVVDSKASLTAYRDASNSTDPQFQKAKLLEHAKAVKTRINELISKKYQEHVPESADFVVCFIPGECFFSAALVADPDLLEYAAINHVVLASPTTLLTLLRAVALGWKESKFNDDAKLIQKMGLELYERIRTSLDKIKALGKGLEDAVDSYDEFLGSMEHRVLPQARRFRGLVDGSKELSKLKPVERRLRKPTALDWTTDATLLLPSLVADEDESSEEDESIEDA